MFYGLAIVCDEYFVAGLERIIEEFEISEDVAGATLMAAGGSAPELATSFIGVFVAQSDIGFGTIVGSATFNILAVIGLCAVFAPGSLPLTWWPLFRDCTFYSIALLVLAGCTADSQIDWYEALVLLLLYVTYVTIMYFNERLRGHAERAMACLKGSCCGAGGKGNAVRPKPLEEASSGHEGQGALELAARRVEEDERRRSAAGAAGAAAGGASHLARREHSSSEESKAQASHPGAGAGASAGAGAAAHYMEETAVEVPQLGEAGPELGKVPSFSTAYGGLDSSNPLIQHVDMRGVALRYMLKGRLDKLQSKLERARRKLEGTEACADGDGGGSVGSGSTTGGNMLGAAMRAVHEEDRVARRRQKATLRAAVEMVLH